MQWVWLRCGRGSVCASTCTSLCHAAAADHRAPGWAQAQAEALRLERHSAPVPRLALTQGVLHNELPSPMPSPRDSLPGGRLSCQEYHDRSIMNPPLLCWSCNPASEAARVCMLCCCSVGGGS